MNNQPPIEVQKIQKKIAEIKTKEANAKNEEEKENNIHIRKLNEPFTKMISRDQILNLKMVCFLYSGFIFLLFRKTKLMIKNY